MALRKHSCIAGTEVASTSRLPFGVIVSAGPSISWSIRRFFGRGGYKNPSFERAERHFRPTLYVASLPSETTPASPNIFRKQISPSLPRIFPSILELAKATSPSLNRIALRTEVLPRIHGLIRSLQKGIPVRCSCCRQLYAPDFQTNICNQSEQLPLAIYILPLLRPSHLKTANC